MLSDAGAEPRAEVAGKVAGIAADTGRLREMQGRGEPWEPFLLRESGLPGPRGNLELVAAVADEGSAGFFHALVAEPVPEAESANTQEEFLVVCGLVGLGRLLAEGRRDVLPILRRYASDTHWRSREGVAMALQRWGDADRHGLLSEMRSWAAGNRYEQRAAVAALCEPRLLRDPDVASGVLDVLDGITASLVAAADRREERLPRPASGAWVLLERGGGGRPRAGQGGHGALAGQRRPRRPLGHGREPQEEPSRARGRGVGGGRAGALIARRTRPSGRESTRRVPAALPPGRRVRGSGGYEMILPTDPVGAWATRPDCEAP